MSNIPFDYLDLTFHQIPPSAGKLLLAEPFSSELFFKKTAVLLTDYSASGAVGFILNKPLEVKLSDLMEDIVPGPSEISLGGPVGGNTLHFIHTIPSIPESVEILPGIYWSGHLDELKKKLPGMKIHGNSIRFFLGYSGWSAGQLEQELEHHAWIVTSPEASSLMQASSTLWEDSLSKMGGKYRFWANFPDDPSDN